MIEKTLLLNSGKCVWGSCFACGWGRLVGAAPDIHRLKNTIDEFFRKTKADRIKVFASGSFLDEKQFPRAIRRYLAEKCRASGSELVVESRPEFITKETLKDFSGVKLVVAIGLECADDKILKKYNKGFTVEDYVKAVKILKESGCRLRTYLMVNIPFVKNQKQILKKSVKFAMRYSDEIVLINTFPHSLAPLFNLWLDGAWKPLDKKEWEKIIKPYKKYPNIEFDFNNFAFEPRFPREKQLWIKGATKKELMHPYFELWQDYICRFYEKPEKRENILFVPCTYTKPYFKSRLHREILKIVPKNVHLVVISSPGVIPYEFVNRYPFDRYDWPEWLETPQIKKLYIKVTAKRIERYLRAHKYKKYFCYLKPTSESYQALKKACNELNVKLVDCLYEETWEKIKDEKNPLALPDALNDLKEIILYNY